VSQYPPAPPPYGPAPVNHPKSTTILVLGILSLVLCQVLGPFAWVMGNAALREIDASRMSPHPLAGRDLTQAGRICGIIATVLMVLGLLLVVFVFALGGALGLGST
jgi:hypothetical protein